MKLVPLFALLLTAAALGPPAAAQQHGGSHHGQHATTPYAGLEARPIKALSDEQIADLRAGRGMGLALAAELNGYPGPTHVLEHAAALELSERQRASMQDLVTAMKAETIPIGEAIISAEMQLEQSFRSGTITRANLEAATSAIGELQGELRAAHLGYHLATIEALSPEQVRRYNELRGYAGATPNEHR